MTTTTTFTTLKSDVEAYLERGSTAAADPVFVAQIPRIINLAERRIAREMKVQGLLNVVTTAMTVSQSVYPKPDRWRDTVSINIGTGTSNTTRTILFPRSYEYMRTYWPDESLTDTPLFYSDYDYDNWLFLPTPDDTYPMEILYYELPPLLDDTTQTNWLTEFAPELLLYATLLEASLFLKDESRIALWQPNYDRALQMLNGEDMQKILDRSVRRSEA